MEILLFQWALEKNGNYKQGTPIGHWQFFYEHGGLWQEVSLILGLESGIWQYYDDLGQIKFVGAFDHGKQIGLWYKYNRKGKKKKWKQFD